MAYFLKLCKQLVFWVVVVEQSALPTKRLSKTSFSVFWRFRCSRRWWSWRYNFHSKRCSQSLLKPVNVQRQLDPRFFSKYPQKCVYLHQNNNEFSRSRQNILYAVFVETNCFSGPKLQKEQMQLKRSLTEHTKTCLKQQINLWCIVNHSCWWQYCT